MDHHLFQGVKGVDTDIPTSFEGRSIRGKFAKLLAVIFIWVPYGIRPLFIRPKSPDVWVALNWIVEISFCTAVVHFWGWQAFFYLLGSVVTGLSLHPCSGHFIQEHFVFDESGQETYSYYGPLNKIMFNVGYHQVCCS